MKWSNCERMRLVVVGVIAVIVASGGSAKADFVWTQKAEMPVARYKHSTCVVDGKIYSIGGADPQWNALTRVDEYDPATDTWTRKADIPTAPGFASTSVVNEKIYVICGDAPAGFSSARVEVYDPSTDTWTQQTELPTKRDNVTSSVVDGIIYVIAGNDGVTGRTGLVEAYDPTTDIWMQKTSMLGSKTFTSSCVVDGKIYVIGGAWTREDVEAYDPATDTWTWKADMPTPRYGLDTVVVDSKIYAIGGWYHSEDGPIYSTVEVYDPVTDTWTKGVDIPVTTAGLSASVVDGKIYVVGGATATHENDNWIMTSAVYASEPIVDLNGDGIVNAIDMCIMVEHWGEDYSLCDIGPMPWGDGIVDVEDLKVLAEHMFEENFPPGLLAYWKLDETEGDTAHDSIEGNDGFGPPDLIWRPEDGKVGGALELDGIDDSVVTTFSLNPVQTTFSAFAWIKGGGPEQVALSQNDGVNWLLADSEGQLMTALRRGSSGPRLTSEYVITDGDWHHIGVVWDKSHRHLYADGIEVAEDSNNVGYLSSSNGNLCIGCGNSFDAGSFFSGLIDDVRIYNKALYAEEIAALAQ